MCKKSILFLFSLILLYDYAAAENCLDTWLPDNSRNILLNPGFEHTPGWERFPDKPGVKTSIDHSNSHSGKRSLRVKWDGNLSVDGTGQNYFHTFQTVSVTPGLKYKIMGHIKTDGVSCKKPDVDATNGIRIIAYDPVNGPDYFQFSSESLHDTNDWTALVAESRIPEKTTQLKVELRRFAGTEFGMSFGTAWWDDVQLLPVPEIKRIHANKNEIIIEGQGFGNDPGHGRSSKENCVLRDGLCIEDSSIESWADNKIVIDNIGDGAIRIKSGGIVSNSVVSVSEFVLSNDTISIGFPRLEAGEGIGQITDIATKREFLEDLKDIFPLYEFTVKDSPFARTKVTLTSRNATSISKTYKNENGSQILTITARHCDEFIATAIITLPAARGGAKFKINIQNLGHRTIQSVRYPIMAAKSKLGNDSADDAVIIPEFEGYLLKNPGALGPTTKYKDMEHPGEMTVQMTAYYDSEKPDAGLYFSMDDSEGYKKRFGFERINDSRGNYLLFSFLHSTSESTGNSLSLTYHINIDTFSGDWYDAADRYKKWALTQPWTSLKLSERSDVPVWLYNIKTMIGCFRCIPDDYAAIVKKYGDLLGVPDILLFPGGFWGIHDGIHKIEGEQFDLSWAGIDYFSDDLLYSDLEADNPPLTKLKKVIDDLKMQNINVLLFIEGLYWDLYFFKLPRDINGKINKYFNEKTVIPENLLHFDDRPHYYVYGDPNIILNEDGSKKFLRSFAYDTTKFGRLTAITCIGSESNNVVDKVIYNNIKRGIDHGADLMSLDGIVSGKISGCWNPAHGHPIGEGKWTHDRYVSVLKDISGIIKEKGKYGKVGIAMEEPNELYLPYLQFQYQRISELGWRGNKKIPLFNYIYKEFFLGIDEGDYLAYENIFYRWSLATAFLQGNIQGTYVDGSLSFQPVKGIITFYKRLISMKRPEYYKAKMLHPPKFKGLPDETEITWKGNKYYIDTVLTGVLKTDANTISYLLVNADHDGSRTYTIHFDIYQYDLPYNKVDLKIIKNGKVTSSMRDILLPFPATVSLAGGDVVEVRVE